MWLFILATWYCESVSTTTTYKPSTYFKEQYLCEANGKDTQKYWYYMRYCYNELQPNSKHIFDYCECRVPKTGEKYYYGAGWIQEKLFCYNYTNNPASTPQLTRTPMKTIKPRTKKTPPKINVLLTQQLLYFSLTQ